jgi:molybdopterin molybdotransferase
VIKERIEVQKDLVLVKQWVPPGNNIRWCGEEIKQGQKILSGGTLLTSRHIGFLSSLGIARVNVHRPPLVGIVSTGSELTTAMDSSKKVLEPGKIFDSNTPMLVACLKELALEPNFTRQVSDDAEKIFASLEVALKLSDVLLVSGGVSVGDFDYTKGLFHDLGIREVFWGVAQKPGKPFYFGTRGEKWIFGLPGNPASVWTCFYEYVRPALLRLLGRTELHPPTFQVPLTQTQKRDPHKTLFLKGRWEKNTKTSQVQSLQGQGSHMLGSLADANCLLVIPPGEEILPVGELVEVHPLSYGGPSYD